MCHDALRAVFIVLGIALSGAHAEIKPAADAPKPMTPEQSAATVRMPKGFRLELVASEPLVQDPSCIAFDEWGRLFVCELHGYNIEGHLDVTELNKSGKLDTKVRRLRWEFIGGKVANEAKKLQHGTVKMLRDTNGDGLMDKAEVWAEGLPPSYGVIAARGGIIVVAAPDIVFLADRDGDGKVDVRETLFTGFKKREMERGINNPHWGLDGWIYVGAGGHGGTIRGPHLKEIVKLQHADFRIKADGSALEPVNGRVSTFGLPMNDLGDRFPCDGTRPAIYALPLPYHMLARNPFVTTPKTNYWAANYIRGYRLSKPHPWRVRRRADPAWIKFYGNRETVSSNFSGGCGAEIYRDTQFPKKYRGNYFYCEPSLNIIHRCVLTRDGNGGYTARRAPEEQQSEFLAATDQWFRPINLRVGPDGSMYIVDMSREIIEDYSAIPRFLQQQYGLNKGGDRGRIWRLVHEQAVKREPANMTKLSTAELVRATGHASVWRRYTAQRLLVERGDKSAAAGLASQVSTGKSPQGRLQALYTLAGLKQLGLAEVQQALADSDYGVRSHALRMAAEMLDKNGTLLAQVTKMTSEQDPRVRLELALALGESNDPRAAAALLRLARQHGDQRWMSAAILSSAGDNAGAMLIGLLRDQSRGNHGDKLLRPLAATIAGRRDGPQIARVLRALAGSKADVQTACLAGFNTGLARGRQPAPQSADGWAPLKTLLRVETPSVKAEVIRLAALLSFKDSGELKAVFAKAAQDAISTKRSRNQRQQALQILAGAPYETLAPVATTLLDAKQDPAVQRAVVEALSDSTDSRVGKILLSPWSGYTPAMRDLVIEALLTRENRLPALLDTIERGVVRRGDLHALQREQLTASGNKQISLRAKKLFASPAASAELLKRVERYQKALVGKRDLNRGRAVYLKNCSVCHKLGNEGHQVGPTLGSIANKPDEVVLLDLLIPSSHIEAEYRSYLVVTSQGLTVSGILVSESPTSVTLRKEKGVDQAVLRSDIESIRASDISLMPSNLHEQVKPQDAADLIAYLRKAFASQKPSK